MATRARREQERDRRKAAGLDYSDAAINAAVGALDSSSSSYGSSSNCGSGSSDSGSSGSGCD